MIAAERMHGAVMRALSRGRCLDLSALYSIVDQILHGNKSSSAPSLDRAQLRTWLCDHSDLVDSTPRGWMLRAGIRVLEPAPSARRKALADPEVRARMSAASRKAWADPEVRARMSAASRKALASRGKVFLPDLLGKMVEASASQLVTAAGSTRGSIGVLLHVYRDRIVSRWAPDLPRRKLYRLRVPLPTAVA